ncbi:MAG: bifunctional phosphopantothenoylcysteine decarboxylase/phosphopantothenate--cysteine ligase CoaBC [Saprospiraceae bacterium]
MAIPTKSLSGRRIIVGVSGSIAAYKAVLLVRLLVKAGAEVRVIMTPSATEFASTLTFSTLSKHEVLTSVISEEGWNNHVELGLWADAYVVAPVTANTLAKLANGICDTVLAAVYLSARCPVMFAPAMDVDMWHHPSTQANIKRLESYGNAIIPVGEGELASGLSGAGRLAEPETIVDAIAQKLKETDAAQGKVLAGKTVLLTAGPTHEPLDPVRFIGNHSSGKMGIAITAALLQKGARVELILGPASAKPAAHPNLTVTHVKTAMQMHDACVALWPTMDAGIMTAAVADYRPQTAADKKIKKSGNELSLTLVKNPDIAAALGKVKQAHQRLIGFALETNDGKKYALGKMQRKNFDAIVLNLHTPEATAFGGDTNQVTILKADGEELPFERMSKVLVAQEVVEVLVALG